MRLATSSLSCVTKRFLWMLLQLSKLTDLQLQVISNVFLIDLLSHSVSDTCDFVFSLFWLCDSGCSKATFLVFTQCVPIAYFLFSAAVAYKFCLLHNTPICIGLTWKKSLLALPLAEQGLCNGTVSVRLSVCSIRPPHGARRCCVFAAVGPASRSYRLVAAWRS